MSTDVAESPPIISGLEYVRPLGAGGYSNVYLYEQAMPKRQVAVKVLKQGLTESVRRQFTEEANAMAALEHPNIVPVLTADVAADGRPYLVMIFYPRHNLGVRAATERFAVSEVLRIGIQIASAVETAHRAGILHRDIKPANILTDQYGKVGLTDFGIATQAAASVDDEDVGVSVPWAPPEVLFATAPATVQSDVYSLGATLWHLLVGRSPFEVPGGDNSQLPLMQRIRTAAVPSTGRGDVPPALERLLGQVMAKDPAARPPSALDLARSLQAIEQEQQLTRTEIVVATEDPLPARVPEVPGLDDNKTRMKAPTRIDAQAQAPTPPAPFAAPATAAEHKTVVRDRPSQSAGAASPSAPTPGSVPPATVRRAPVVSPEAGAVEALEAPVDAAPTRNRWVGIAVLGAVLVLIVVVGLVVLSGGGGDDSAGSGSSTQTAPPDDIGPPGQPTVMGKRIDPATAEFTWTYSNSADTDSYRWQLSDGSNEGLVDEPTVRVASPAGTEVCVQVKVVRVDGSNPALDWSEKGCTT